MIEVTEAIKHAPTISTAPDFSHTVADVPGFARLGSELTEATQRQVENHFLPTDFLSAPAAQFLLLAIMERSILLGRARERGQISQENAIAESLLNSDLLLLLGGTAHKFHLPNRDKISPRLKLSEEAIAGAHFEFEIPALSRELEDKLTQFKTTLPEASRPSIEQPYRIVALNILSNSGLTQAEHNSNESLLRNTKHFVDICGGQGFTGSAWTISLNGSSIIAFPLDSAIACLENKTPEKLPHEFFHTQYPLNTVGLGFLLLFAEEVRARKLAEDSRSHPDIDSFSYSLRQITGIDVLKNAVSLSPSGNYDFLVRSARTIGTQRTLELAAILPEAYRNSSPFLPASISNRLGNAAGVLRRVASQRPTNSRIAA